MQTETERISELKFYNILDTPAEEAFDRIATIAAEFFNTPIALISLVDENRIWFKARHGLGADEIPRVPGLCASAILSDDVYVVKNAVCDVRTKDNPLVVGPLGLRFYAAAPLITRDGFRLGTLNVIDTKEREFSPGDAYLLKQLAAVVVDLMEVRLAARQTITSLSKVLVRIKHPQELQNLVTVCAWSKKIKINGEWISFEKFILDELGMRITHGMTPEAAAHMLESRPDRSASDELSG
jgi:hypothetical protein